MGLIENELRLPLVPVEPATEKSSGRGQGRRHRAASAAAVRRVIRLVLVGAAGRMGRAVFGPRGRCGVSRSRRAWIPPPAGVGRAPLGTRLAAVLATRETS